jgi:hypothetical protein
MRTSRFHVIVAVLLLLVGISAKLLAQEQKSPSHGEPAKAVNLVRLINTAENWYDTGINTNTGAIEAHGRYASWDELNNSGVLKTLQDQFRSQASGARVSLRSSVQWAAVKDLQVSAGPEVMPGYRLDLLISVDGQSYSLALHDTREGDGLFSLFSDQSGIIYSGSALQ